ncbi:hypothetical protein HAN_1g82 (nucleomorph) [Hemiselmis andersenii]|uniref:Uncharacterized protein n=1 Tax=Hemiselmis andersenii TaxID=464988 RepID=A9BK93_HEMAN|nr:hypothetical protein HAN_1g82 [Hemiselmis andersenii]ABW97926.1 hypothetical protein HAN_1g82 [Hemiselmis andersenii]
MGFFVCKCKVTGYNKISLYRKNDGTIYNGGTKIFLKDSDGMGFTGTNIEMKVDFPFAQAQAHYSIDGLFDIVMKTGNIKGNGRNYIYVYYQLLEEANANRENWNRRMAEGGGNNFSGNTGRGRTLFPQDEPRGQQQHQQNQGVAGAPMNTGNNRWYGPGKIGRNGITRV